MDDRQLLELAAKAAGIGGRFDVDCIRTEVGQGSCGSTCWNPLHDDGDALRLAVQLSFLVDSDYISGRSEAVGRSVPAQVVRHNGDPCAATRRAIVLAAAEIGRGFAPTPAKTPEDWE